MGSWTRCTHLTHTPGLPVWFAQVPPSLNQSQSIFQWPPSVNETGYWPPHWQQLAIVSRRGAWNRPTWRLAFNMLRLETRYALSYLTSNSEEFSSEKQGSQPLMRRSFVTHHFDIVFSTSPIWWVYFPLFMGEFRFHVRDSYSSSHANSLSQDHWQASSYSLNYYRDRIATTTFPSIRRNRISACCFLSILFSSLGSADLVLQQLYSLVPYFSSWLWFLATPVSLVLLTAPRRYDLARLVLFRCSVCSLLLLPVLDPHSIIPPEPYIPLTVAKLLLW
jgi:hypothetical protein